MAKQTDGCPSLHLRLIAVWLGLVYGAKMPFAVAYTRLRFTQSDGFLNYKLNHRLMNSELHPIIGVKPT